jgi:hypothetical protein
MNAEKQTLMMEIRDWIEAGALFVAFVTIIITMRKNRMLQNWKQSEIKDALSQHVNQNSERISVVEHEIKDMKEDHLKDMAEIKSLVKDNYQYNRDDHGKLFDQLRELSNGISTISATCLLIQKQKKNEND